MYKQVRSIASEGIKLGSASRSLAFYVVDLREELIGIEGVNIWDQVTFTNDAIAALMRLHKVSSVALVGHSMGGLVARGVLMHKNFLPASVSTIITLATPHVQLTGMVDPSLYRFYNEVNEFWRINPKIDDVALISIGGDYRDTQISSSFVDMSKVTKRMKTIYSIMSTSIDKVHVPADHLAIMWCNQVVKAVARALMETVDPITKGVIGDPLKRFEALKVHLSPPADVSAMQVNDVLLAGYNSTARGDLAFGDYVSDWILRSGKVD